MNLPKFLNEVDSVTDILPKEQLGAFIHDVARTLPEERRVEFLDRLKALHGQGEAIKEENKDSVKFEMLKEKLEKIERGELCLIGSLNEEYDDWYNSDSEEFLYEDPKKILGVIEQASDFVHQCVDTEAYQEGYEIADMLLGLEIMVGGEYLDYTDDPISIDELGYYQLSDLDYKQLVVDALHAAYCANELSERAEILYRMIENAGKVAVSLEMVMQSGMELPEVDKFLELWIAYLGKINSVTAQKLLKEAVQLANNQEKLLESARGYYVQHPALYEQYIQSNLNQDNLKNEDMQKLFAVGKEALEKIDSQYIVRSRIALLTGKIALHLAMEEEAERCWLEAFRSDTKVVNYLRLLIECRDFAKIKSEADGIVQAQHTQEKGDNYSYLSSDNELAQNQISNTMYHMLVFLGGEFQYVADHAMKVDKAVGWSYTFMKCGMAAFLLLLLEDDELKQGGQEMCRRLAADTGFKAADYFNGLLKMTEESDQECFWKCFCRWKETVSLSEEEKQGYVEWLQGLVTKRVDGIMEGNHRKYYGECASYIAALGEVKESMGATDGKQETMMQYKMQYSRRTAFHSELVSYGMKNQGKR